MNEDDPIELIIRVADEVIDKTGDFFAWILSIDEEE